MSDVHQEPKTDADLASRSSLYAEFLAEREEILRHKWIESEKAGRDIGFVRALIDWTRHHRARWRLLRRSSKAALGAPSQTEGPARIAAAGPSGLGRKGA